MRVNEKTVELNFCSQTSPLAGQQLLWFGLTQKQEARMGFDACTRLAGRILIFQFKASNQTLRSGARRFQVAHRQLAALRDRAKSHRRCVFYAFPMIGESSEIAANGGDFLGTTWLVDVTDLAGLAAPTRRDGAKRKNGRHNVDLWPGRAVFRSRPQQVPAINAAEFFEEGFPGADGLRAPIDLPADAADARTLIPYLRRAAVGLVIAARPVSNVGS